LQSEQTRCANRIPKVLQDASIKLSSAATDALGKSWRDTLAASVAGEDDLAVPADSQQKFRFGGTASAFNSD